MTHVNGTKHLQESAVTEKVSIVRTLETRRIPAKIGSVRREERENERTGNR